MGVFTLLYVADPSFSWLVGVEQIQGSSPAKHLVDEDPTVHPSLVGEEYILMKVGFYLMKVGFYFVAGRNSLLIR